jgi:hypothetical protein
MDYDAISIRMDEALYRCSSGMNPKDLLEQYLDARNGGHCRINLQHF